MLEARQLGYQKAGCFILQAINFTLAKGSVLALLGPNGAGKTTLLRCLSGFYQPSAGSLLVADAPLPAASQRARLLSYLPHKAMPGLGASVLQAVLLGRHPYARLKFNAADLEAAQKAIDLLRLRHLASRPLASLSAGEQQRARMARVFTQNTPVILLDEPLNNLDPAWQLELLAILKRMAEDEGKTIVLSMHDLSLASRFCSHALLLKQGRLLAFAATDSVLTKETLALAYGLNIHIGEHSPGLKSFIALSPTHAPN